MYDTGKAAQVAAEMRNYRLSILGISETRWNGSGQIRLSKGELVLYSGQEEDRAPHMHGVAFMLYKTAQRQLIGWEAHGPRIITASLKTRKRRINMNVYRRGERGLLQLPERNITILMGDLNAKIGCENIGYEEVMGQQGLGEMNDYGERFANLCATSNLVINGSIFPHQRINKATWVSPDLSTENQIDHVCITRKFKRSLQDVCIRRGADIASDHHLIVACLKLKLKKTWTGVTGQRQKYNTTLLKEPTKSE
ncbi:putative craniofacial development protein 2-like [Triplophysa rosa]|uniref:Craniofacial development protein 2-like n=1 Tax=Triplophysa rosa TaxID=992332 RepID=A0A9W7T4Q5_TRIRA|nr:putative craniofacial development protein 2-like [Triplophysa rosa]